MTNLERKKKIENFWYYYKIHTFVAIFILFAIVVTVTTRDTSKKYGLGLTFVGQNVLMSDKVDNFQKDINANISSMLLGDKTDPTMQMADITKFTAMMQVGELDVIISDKATFSNYSKQGAFMKLDELLKNDKLPKGLSYEKISDNSSKNITGIDIKNSKILKAYGYDYKNMIIAIAATTKHLDASVKLINQLIK